MSKLSVSLACLLLAGCAGSAAVPPRTSNAARATAAPEAAASRGPDQATVPNATIVQLGRAMIAPEPQCRRENSTGSRIMYETCSAQRANGKSIIDEEVTRAQLEEARAWAVYDEQRRLQEAAVEQQRRRAMSERPSQ